MLGEKERALSRFFKDRSEDCKTAVRSSNQSSSSILEFVTGKEAARFTDLAEASVAMLEMSERLANLSFLADQQEGVQADILRDLSGGRTLSECLAEFKKLLENQNLPSSLRQYMREQFGLLDNEHVFEP